MVAGRGEIRPEEPAGRLGTTLNCRFFPGNGHENAAEIRFASKDLQELRSSLQMAEEVGNGVGRGTLLLREMQKGTKGQNWIDAVWRELPLTKLSLAAPIRSACMVDVLRTDGNVQPMRHWARIF